MGSQVTKLTPMGDGIFWGGCSSVLGSGSCALWQILAGRMGSDADRKNR